MELDQDRKSEFIRKSRNKHGNKYDYSKFLYKNNKTKGVIICPIHGEFWQQPNHHTNGSGCPKCQKEKLKHLFSNNNDIFIEKSITKHGLLFDYSEVNYVNNRTPVRIKCLKHGYFEQAPHEHYNGNGCFLCTGKGILTTEFFIIKARLLHGDRYDYSKVICNGNNKEKVCIICSVHGEFWQRPNDHLRDCNCPHCNESKLEKEISILLDKNNIIYQREKRFDWLGKQELDFYLPDYNVAIECQGGQHFEINNYFHRDQNHFIRGQELDKLKFDLCQENGVKILYFTNKQYKKYNERYLGKLFVDKNELLIELKELLAIYGIKSM